MGSSTGGARAWALALAALALASPAASGAWRTQNEEEPNTPQDVADGFHFAAADADPNPATRRVYFNAFATMGVRAVDNGGHGGLSPNVPGTRLAPPGSLSFTAYLGVWKDCNADGYVGDALGALWHYPVERLGPASPCAAGGPHVHAGWVWELLQIGVGPREGSIKLADPAHGILDPEANVWGDFGLPGERPRGACAVFYLPPGTLRGTGPMVAYADCFTDHAVAETLALADPDGSLGLAFEDPRRPERDCRSLLSRDVPLFQPGPCSGQTGAWQENSGNPAITAWDCSRTAAAPRDPTAPEEGGRGSLSQVPGTETPRRDPTPLADEDGAYLRAPMPAPGVRDPRGSWFDAINATITSVDVGASPRDGCGRPPDSYARAGRLLDFTFLVERNVSRSTDGALKRAHDFPMRYQSGEYGEEPGSFAEVEVLRQTYPYGWTSAPSTTYGPPDYMGGTVRRDLSPAGPLRFTFYAKVGHATLDVAQTARPPARYGSEACATEALAAASGWDCEPSRWWNPDHGAPARPLFATPARVWETYHLRDVDCHDGSVAPGATLSLVPFSGEEPCWTRP